MMTLQHEFVEFIPEKIPYGKIFISIKYKTAAHMCVCGCNNKVVTPITPTDWQLTFDGASISLSPSIGNWNFECKSHYWIIKSQIRYSYLWTEKEITAGRKKDIKKKKKFFFKRKRKDNGSNESG